MSPLAARHDLSDKLKDAQQKINSLTSANDRLREENQQLRLDKDTAASRYCELSDEIAVFRAQVLSLTEEKQTYSVLVLAGGLGWRTNDISAGEDATTVSEGIEHLLQTAKVTYPHSKIVINGIHHRNDSSPQINMTI